MQKFFHKKYLTLLLLGFASGLPLALTLSSLTAWLAYSGVEKKSIGLFALVGLPYTVKFLWAHMVDNLHLPFISKIIGKKLSWAFLCQIGIICSIIAISSLSPTQDIMRIAYLSILLAFFSATQDIAIDGFRIDILTKQEQAYGIAQQILGYRLAMLASGAGVLYIAHYSNWQQAYLAMAILMQTGVLAVFLAKIFNIITDFKANEIKQAGESLGGNLGISRRWLYAGLSVVLLLAGYLLFASISDVAPLPFKEGIMGNNGDMGDIRNVGAVNSGVIFAFIEDWQYSWLLLKIFKFLMVAVIFIILFFAVGLLVTSLTGKNLDESLLQPFKDFANRKYWWLILLFITLFKLCDAFAAVMLNPFFKEMGFSLHEIASITKLYGFVATIIGLFIGGFLLKYYGLFASLLISAILQMLSNLIFVLQAEIGYNNVVLALTITGENLAGGIGTAVFVGYISLLCNKKFSATQYALLSALASVGRVVISSYAGFVIEDLEGGGLFMASAWSDFFVISAVIAVPSILMLIFLKKFLIIK